MVRISYRALLYSILYISLMNCATDVNKESKKPLTADEFDQEIFSFTRTFAEVISLAGAKHYCIRDVRKCMTDAMETFLNRLDPHSSFLDPETYEKMLKMTSGEFYGIGVVFDNTRKNNDKSLLVIDVLPDGPAEKAGIKPKDKIVEVDGKVIENMSNDEIIAMIKGARHTTVHIKVLREHNTNMLGFDITRDIIKEQNSLCFHIPTYNIYYLSLNSFTDNSVKQIGDLLKKAISMPYNGLILDLRNNTGGLLTAATAIAGLFVEPGSLVVATKNKENKVIEEHRTKRAPLGRTTMPIVILINNYTASAAEILTGVLKQQSEELSKKARANGQDRLMVFVVGTQSFGKASVQELIPVSNNSAVKLTTALYYLPGDVCIQGVGIEPDFKVEHMTPPTQESEWLSKHYGRERALKYSLSPLNIELPQEEDKKKPKLEDLRGSERAQYILNQDNQFRTGLMLINVLVKAQKECPQTVNTRDKAIKYIAERYMPAEQLSFTEVK